MSDNDRNLADDLSFALELAAAADATTLPRFESADFSLGWKDDRTEVTEVDRATEQLLAKMVHEQRPDDGFIGEEFGLSGKATSPWRWVVDPIDGTSGFVRGIPVWASLIALVEEQPDGVDEGASIPLVGVVSAPALGRRWWASADGGAFDLTSQLQVSDVASIADAQVNVTINDGWAELGKTDALTTLLIEARRSRGFGDFWQHCLVAEGALDVAIDAIGVAAYDVAAVRLIVTEAGGRFSDREGNPSHQNGSAISTNGVLHDEIIARLRD